MAPPLRSSRGTLAMMFVAMMALTPLVQAKIIVRACPPLKTHAAQFPPLLNHGTVQPSRVRSRC
jgi:hypothetical protein